MSHNHKSGKIFNGSTISTFIENDYDNKNDFPYHVSHTGNKLSFITKFSSECHPKKKTIFNNHCDNVFTVINVKKYHLSVKIFNQENKLLNHETLVYD